MLRSKKKPEPTHVKVVVLGESGVGKTCFCDMVSHRVYLPEAPPWSQNVMPSKFVLGRTFIYYDPTNQESSRRLFSIDGVSYLFEFMDLNSTIYHEDHQRLHPDIYDSVLSNTNALVLLYDVTSKESFDRVTNHAYFHAWACRSTTNGLSHKMQREALGCVLVGNKVDVLKSQPQKRQVEQEMAEEWAASQGFRHIEISVNARNKVEEAVELLVRDFQKMRAREERRTREMVEEEKARAKEAKDGAGWKGKKVLSGVIHKALAIGSK